MTTSQELDQLCVNTIPLETLTAYRAHGDPAPRLEEDGEHALRELHKLAEVDISEKSDPATGESTTPPQAAGLVPDL